MTAVLLLFVFAALLQLCDAGKHRRRNQRRKSGSTSPAPTATSTQNSEKESEIRDPIKETSGRKQRGSRRKDRERRPSKMPILKTSMRAKKVTERKYLKRDWCKSQPVRQHIQTTTNCHGVVINQFCYGQCNSFYIPKDIVIDADQEIVPDYFKSCSFCKPKNLEWVSVRLRCKNIENTKMPRFITKRIKRVKGCTCVAVPDLEKYGPKQPADSEASGPPVLATMSPDR